MQSNFVDVFHLIQVFGCLKGTPVVTKVLGGRFVSSESVSYPHGSGRKFEGIK